MEVLMRRGDLATRPSGAVAVGVFQGVRKLESAAAAVDRVAGGALAALLQSGNFGGRWGETAVVHPARGRIRRVIVIGLGPAADFGVDRVRQAAALGARRARELSAGTLTTVVHGAGRGGLPPEVAAQASAEGAVLGHYRHTAYLRDPGPEPLRRVEFLEPDATLARSMAPAIERGSRWAEATCLARDLSATPGQDLTPEALADRAREIAKDAGAKAVILGVPQLERLGMGALLAVGRGSVQPPRFIVLERGPAVKSRGARLRTVVVIGKGVTFDTGGLSLKPRENMHKMKYDMSGAAAVLGMFSALPSIDCPLRVIGLIPAAENMPGGRALKPGDVVRALDGTTIEVTNTDAEGRLILADALGYARRYAPDAVVDLATLTGAISIALGHQAAGLFSTDDALAAELERAASATGERLWRMPLWGEDAAAMKSDVADLLNSSGERDGGAILGAIFLRHFARGLRWAHLDIASTAWAPADRPGERRGPTGFGVRLLLQWLCARSSSADA